MILLYKIYQKWDEDMKSVFENQVQDIYLILKKNLAIKKFNLIECLRRCLEKGYSASQANVLMVLSENKCFLKGVKDFKNIEDFSQMNLFEWNRELVCMSEPFLYLLEVM